MNKTILLLSLVAFVASLFMTFNNYNSKPASTDSRKLSYNDIALAIKNKYDQELDKLEDYKASHYAARIYRISGATSYLTYNVKDLWNMKDEAHELLQTARNSTEAEFSKAKADSWAPGIRTELRRKSLDIAPSLPYYLSSLSLLRRALEYRVCYVEFDQLKERVLAKDYTHSLTDPFMIKAWAAQLANVVVWIKLLGGKDYSDIFLEALQTVYPHDQDESLSTQQYENKIYGLTHMILASSQYYQYHINRADFAWIFDFFDNHIDDIVSRAKADVVAEVGIAYLLAREYNHPALEKTKQNIARQYNETYHMIPSVEGLYDFSPGAHRNILAIMLLMSPQQLHPGWPSLLMPGNYLKTNTIASISGIQLL